MPGPGVHPLPPLCAQKLTHTHTYEGEGERERERKKEKQANDRLEHRAIFIAGGAAVPGPLSHTA